jgi:hybrid cluster-associated redox disulfide protein
MTAQPTLELTMADLIDRWPAAAPVLTRYGMACVGCGMAKFETIAEATAAYGVDPQAFLRAIARASRLRRAISSDLRRPL